MKQLLIIKHYYPDILKEIIMRRAFINQEYFFNQDLKIINTQNGKFKCNVNCFDMLSSFLYGRSLKSSD